ncbi:hypothetical protein ABW20_dc0108747 [Dactylellina cionopaga]|nr:hypothetical protein ABW20_dc0108747 [Dactylellina cionopaga]
MTAPPGGFSDPDLTALFTLTTSTTPPNTGNGSNRNVAAIAGGTIGGVVAIVGFILAFIFFRKRKSRAFPMPPPGNDPREDAINGVFEIPNSDVDSHSTYFDGADAPGGIHPNNSGVFEIGSREVKPPPAELPADDVAGTNRKDDTRERRPLLPPQH